MNKKAKRFVFGGILIAIAVVAICIAMKVVPSVNDAKRITELLQPLLEAENQTMKMDICVDAEVEMIEFNSDIYMLEEETKYIVLKQEGLALYIADNLLLMENGKAFKIAENMQEQTTSYQELIPLVASLYDVFEITTEESENSIVYKITVTGENIEELLSAVSLGESLPVERIQELELYLEERNETLEEVRFVSRGDVSLDVTLNDFRVLASGDYPIPEAVKRSVADVNEEELLSLTEDLYRLIKAVIPLTEKETLDGTVKLLVNCGSIQLDTELELSDLSSSSEGNIDPEQLQAVPELIGWLCMEGDISCTKTGNDYVYSLEIDQTAMGELSEMIVPELSRYGASLSEGVVTVVVRENAISSMKLSIEGTIKIIILQAPVTIEAEYIF